MSDSPDNPREKLEQASDHHETSQEHQKRAKDLAREAADELELQLESELPDDVEVIVDPHYENDGTKFSVQLVDQSVQEALERAVDGETGVAMVGPTEVIIGPSDEVPDLDAKSQRDRIQNLKGIIADIEDEYDEGAPVDVVQKRALLVGITRSKAEHEIEQLKQKGEVYEPRTDHLRTT